MIGLKMEENFMLNNIDNLVSKKVFLLEILKLKRIGSFIRLVMA